MNAARQAHAWRPKKQPKRRVLVVDDSEFVRRALVASFADDAEVEALAVPNGKDALAYLQGQDAVDAIILDVSTPIAGADDVLRALRASFTHHPYVVVVGHRNDRALIDDCLRLGAHKAIAKPLNVDAIHVLLHAAFRRNEGQRTRGNEHR